MVDIKTAWRAPLRRIYLVWGLVLIAGFITSGYGLGDGYWWWYGFSLIGVLSQVIGMRLSSWQSKTLLGLWAVISFGGTLLTHLMFSGNLEMPTFIYHIGFFWLLLLSIPQLITGYILKNKLQMGLGVLWLVVALIFWQGTLIDPLYSWYLIAAITGIPYLYIAFKK